MSFLDSISSLWSGTGSDDKGTWGYLGDISKDIFSGQNILGGVASLGTMLSKEEERKQKERLSEDSFKNQMELLKAEGDIQKEILAMKLAAGGGGGGGGGGIDKQIAAQKAMARYEGMLNTGKNGMATRNADSQNVISALKFLMEGTQKPL